MKRIGAIVFLVLIALGIFAYLSYNKHKKLDEISSFEACVEAEYPILESYPPQCKLPNGKTYTQDIGNELEYSDEILVENPRPNMQINSPVQITGKARGGWFFEASFSGELFDANNKSLGVVVLTAQDEWMTEEFVAFSGELEFQMPETSSGKLIIRNANPSGLPEYEKALIIPVLFN